MCRVDFWTRRISSTCASGNAYVESASRTTSVSPASLTRRRSHTVVPLLRVTCHRSCATPGRAATRPSHRTIPALMRASPRPFRYSALPCRACASAPSHVCGCARCRACRGRSCHACCGDRLCPWVQSPSRLSVISSGRIVPDAVPYRGLLAGEVVGAIGVRLGLHDPVVGHRAGCGGWWRLEAARPLHDRADEVAHHVGLRFTGPLEHLDRVIPAFHQ